MPEVPTSFPWFVGVDLHKYTVRLAAADTADMAGTVIGRLKTSTQCVEKIDALLAAFLAVLSGVSRVVHLAVDACPFVEWFIDRYRDRVARLDIADATELANPRGKRRKTDRTPGGDAADTATRPARGECPLGWIADKPVGELRKRKLGRQWHRLSRTLGRTKASMRSLLLQQVSVHAYFEAVTRRRPIMVG